jgi:hypothetical protein
MTNNFMWYAYITNNPLHTNFGHFFIRFILKNYTFTFKKIIKITRKIENKEELALAPPPETNPLAAKAFFFFFFFVISF